ncbi:MAG: hypothetical protein HQL54_01135 [Magnetococcales bacterium]|nr:hypothetical protein [Magnetococcales bacterium]
MRYLVMGFGSATVWGVLSVFLFGSEALMQTAWVERVFWALAASGVIAGYADAFIRCPICRKHPTKYTRFCSSVNAA